MRPIILFCTVLRDLLLQEHLTPSQLSPLVDLSAETVESWFTGHLPKASSAWVVGKALGNREQEVMRGAALAYHQRMFGVYPDPLIRFEKSISSYLSEGNWWIGLPELEQKRFLEVWHSILGEKEFLRSDTKEEDDTVSNLIILPKPDVLILDEWDEILRRVSENDLRLHELGWKRFEDLITELLQRYGWDATPMGYTKDDGIDVVAVRRVAPDVEFKMMVQCKRFAEARKVGVEIVREVWSVKWEKGFHQAMIATTSTFTRGARQKGEMWNLALKDHDAVVEWCKGLRQPKPV